MSSPVSPITGPSDPPAATRPPAGGSVDDVFAAELDAAHSKGHAAPPPQVLDEVAHAAEVYDDLRREGHVLAFMPTGPGEAPTIELRDLRGNTVRTLTPAEAFAIAAGQPVE